LDSFYELSPETIAAFRTVRIDKKKKGPVETIPAIRG
jgi:hypothetical protein